MAELTDEAKAAIADAVRIVREDRMDSYIRESIGRHAKPKPDEGEGKGGSSDGLYGPPKKGEGDSEANGDAKGEEAPKRRGIWWPE